MIGKPEPPFELLKRDETTEAALKNVFPEATWIIGIREDGTVNVLVTLQIYAQSNYEGWKYSSPTAKASMIDVVHGELLYYMREYIDRYAS